MYVSALDAKTNNVIVNEYNKLQKFSTLLDNANFMKYSEFDQKLKLKAKLNYRSRLIDCYASLATSGIKLDFEQSVTALSPGQSIVLYEGNDLVAGGVIV